jgi:hypothetical protein
MKQRSMLRRPETIPNVPTKLNRLGLVLLCVIACSPISRGERVRKTHDLTAVLTTTDESLTLMAGSRSPKLVSLSGHAGSVWRNEAEEVLPSSVDINGAPVPVTWSFMPDLVSRRASCRIRVRVRSAAPTAALAVGGASQFRTHRTSHHRREPERTGDLAASRRQPQPGLARVAGRVASTLLCREGRGYSIGERYASRTRGRWLPVDGPINDLRAFGRWRRTRDHSHRVCLRSGHSAGGLVCRYRV